MTQASEMSSPRILLNGIPTVVDDAPPMSSLLDWLRDRRGLCGTKEGCAEGDCGACTVVLERLGAGGRVWRHPINACITMLGQLHGAGVRTVEGLAGPGGALHPVQEAFAEGGGTQCGFCTPGFVMATYAFADTGAADANDIHDAIAGNLCRCTGYRPIVDAVSRVKALKADPLAKGETALAAALAAIAPSDATTFRYQDRTFHVPRTLAEAAKLRAENPEALLLAGGTDVGLLVSRQRQQLGHIIHLGGIAELNRIEDWDDTLVLGAAVPYERAFPSLVKYFPGTRSYLTRLGSRQIRSLGTIGGNLGTASPIGDTLPILLALGATILVYSSRGGRREIAADAFSRDYRRTDLADDELIEAVLLPKLTAGTTLYVDKVSKRRDQDISSVCAAFWVAMDGGSVADIRLAFGGLAATTKRARAAEAALIGRPLDDETIADAARVLHEDFAPLSDWRGSSEYRMSVTGNLLRRLHLRMTQPGVPMELDTL